MTIYAILTICAAAAVQQQQQIQQQFIVQVIYLTCFHTHPESSVIIVRIALTAIIWTTKQQRHVMFVTNERILRGIGREIIVA